MVLQDEDLQAVLELALDRARQLDVQHLAGDGREVLADHAFHGFRLGGLGLLAEQGQAGDYDQWDE